MRACCARILCCPSIKKKKKLKSDPILENATAFPIENSLLSDETRDTTQRDFYLSKLNRMATGDGGRGGEEGMIGQRAKKKNETKEGKKRKRKRGGEGEKNSSIFSGVKLFFY